jgi:hypothetical protein
MLSRLRIFLTPPTSDSYIRVENFLENTQKFYDGGAFMVSSSTSSYFDRMGGDTISLRTR